MTLAGAFRRHLDRSVGEAIREARLTRALAEIRRSPRPLAEIAGECGFFDQSHMGRLVKAATGQTPAQIRRRGAVESSLQHWTRRRPPR